MAAQSATGSRSEFLVNGKYRLIRKIGSGSFGDIYLGINVANGEVSIARLNEVDFFTKLFGNDILVILGNLLCASYAHHHWRQVV